MSGAQSGPIYTGNFDASGFVVAHTSASVDLGYIGGDTFFCADVNGFVDAP